MAANLRRDDDERRRHDASHANTAPTPRPPTINGNPSLRIREKVDDLPSQPIGNHVDLSTPNQGTSPHHTTRPTAAQLATSGSSGLLVALVTDRLRVSASGPRPRRPSFRSGTDPSVQGHVQKDGQNLHVQRHRNHHGHGVGHDMNLKDDLHIMNSIELHLPHLGPGKGRRCAAACGRASP